MLDDSTNTPLTDRQLQIARLAGQGWSNHRIGDHLGIQYNTVKTHLSLAMKLLGINKRTQLPEALSRLGIEVTPTDFVPQPAKRTLRPMEVVLLCDLREGKTLPEFAEDHGLSTGEAKTVLKTVCNATGCLKIGHLIHWARTYLPENPMCLN